MDETLETVGVKIDALGTKLDAFGTAVDKRFEQVDKRFEQVDKRFEQVDKRFDEIRGELGTKIEAVDAKVDLLLEGFANLSKKDVANSAAHARMDARLDGHELRIAALEEAGGSAGHSSE